MQLNSVRAKSRALQKVTFDRHCRHFVEDADHRVVVTVVTIRKGFSTKKLPR